jgi:miniconductance mechanosensitive channel
MRRWIMALVFAVLFLAWLLDLLCRKVIIPGVRKVVEKTSIEWDDILLNSDVLGKLSHLLPAALVANLLPMAFFDNPLLEVTITKVTEVYMIIAILRFILSLVKSVYCITEVKNHTGTRPLKGIFQMVQVLVICVGIILVFSVLFGKSPLELLVGKKILARGGEHLHELLALKQKLLAEVEASKTAAGVSADYETALLSEIRTYIKENPL